MPGIEDKMLADPTTRVDILTSLGGAYLMLWRARGATTSGNNRSGGNGQGRDTTLGVVEIRLDVSSDRMDLLHRAQHFLQEALTAPEKMNDPALRAQVGEAKNICLEQLSNVDCCACRELRSPFQVLSTSSLSQHHRYNDTPSLFDPYAADVNSILQRGKR